MAGEWTLAVGLVLGAGGYVALAAYVWRHRTAAGSRGLLGVLISVFFWTTCYALEVTARSVASAEFWSTLKFIGVVGMPPCLLAFALEYTGRRGLSRRGVALLAIVPTLTVLSLMLPPTRDLIHVYDHVLRQAGQLPYPVPTPTSGVLFWPHAIYNYGLAFYALGLTIVRLLKAGPAYRLQAYMVTASALVPLLANIAWNAGVFGPDLKDPTPFLFALCAVTLVWGFFRQELLNFLPVARDLVLEQMADGVLVLDLHDRVVDANPAAATMLHVRRADLIGRPLPDLVPRDSAVVGPFGADVVIAAPAGSTDASGAPRHAADVADRDVAVTATPLVVHGSSAGLVVLLHDVSERQAAQRRLHELLTEQTRVAETLQASLRPASLPEVPGLQMAVRFLPAGPGGHVSGDFYDVHRVLGGDWAFAVGDVSGKGVEAAVVTSMVRYTVRTLSAEGRSPREVLELLNRALLVDEASDRFCTLAYGRLDGAEQLRLSGPGGADEAATVTLRLVLGGHPRPLLRRCDGSVEVVGHPGTALGLMAAVDVDEAVVTLGSGDVLLLYTDGVTEARHGSDEFGEERLAAVLASAAAGLRGRTGVTAAHLVAEAIAERVVTEVTEWASSRDDVALLVLAVP